MIGSRQIIVVGGVVGISSTALAPTDE